MGADAETLTAAGEVGPVRDIEVGLLDFSKADQAVDRAEARAEVERTGAFFLHYHIQIFAAGNDSVGWLRFDLGEIVQILKAFLAHIDKRGVVNLAGLHRQFAADHAVLRPCISLNVDKVDVGLDAFVQAVGEIHCTRTGGQHLGGNRHVDIAATAVEIAHGFDVITHAFRGEKLACIHFE